MNETLFQKAVGLARAGRLDDARGLFVLLIEQDPRSEAAWLWYSDTLRSIEERIEALKQCLLMIPGSLAARDGLEQLKAGRGDLLVLKLDAAPVDRPGSPFLPGGLDEPEPYHNIFQSGEPDSGFPLNGIGAIFTVPPDELTADEIFQAEEKLASSTRKNLVETAKEANPAFPFRRKNAQEAAQGLKPPAGAFSALESEVKKEMAAAQPPAPASPSAWAPLFSDELSRPRLGNMPLEPASIMLDSDAGFPPAPIPPEPQAAQNEQTAGKKGKATAQDWVFYLVVGIVICIILLAVVVIYMVSPGSF